MAKLIVCTFTSLDGVVQAPGKPTEDDSNGFKLGGWLVPFFDATMGNDVTGLIEAVSGFLLGRRTYEIWADHWPRVDQKTDPIARAINQKPKYVASRTLKKADWNNSTVLDGDLASAVKALKARSTGDILVQGSTDVLQTLISNDLVDEYRLLTFPILLGKGKRLFGAGTLPRTLELVDMKKTSTGGIIHTYRPVGDVKVGSFPIEKP